MSDEQDAEPPAEAAGRSTGRAPGRRSVLLRLDPAVHDAVSRWAADELRSVNAQIEMVLRRALAEAGREPAGAGQLPRRGRPPSAGPGQTGGTRSSASPSS